VVYINAIGGDIVPYYARILRGRCFRGIAGQAPLHLKQGTRSVYTAGIRGDDASEAEPGIAAKIDAIVAKHRATHELKMRLEGSFGGR